MQYEVDTPQQYLDQLADDWRKQTLLQIRALIQSHGQVLDEVIQYKMLGYLKGEILVFSLNAQKQYVSLYVGDHRKIDATGELLEDLNVGKGCIRFSKTVHVSQTKIEGFILKTIQLAEQGEDIGC